MLANKNNHLIKQILKKSRKNGGKAEETPKEESKAPPVIIEEPAEEPEEEILDQGKPEYPDTKYLYRNIQNLNYPSTKTYVCAFHLADDFVKYIVETKDTKVEFPSFEFENIQKGGFLDDDITSGDLDMTFQNNVVEFVQTFFVDDAFVPPIVIPSPVEEVENEPSVVSTTKEEPDIVSQSVSQDVSPTEEQDIVSQTVSPVELSQTETPVEQEQSQSLETATPVKGGSLEQTQQGPKEKEESQSPADDETQLQSPINDTEIQSPVSNTEIQSPLNDTEKQSPVSNTEIQSPVDETQTQSPVDETQTQSPVDETQTQSPVDETQIQSPVSDTQIQSPISNTQIQSPEEAPAEEQSTDVFAVVGEKPEYIGFVKGKDSSIYVFVKISSNQKLKPEYNASILNELFHTFKVFDKEVDESVRTLFENNTWLLDDKEPYSGYLCKLGEDGRVANVKTEEEEELINMDSMGEYYYFSFLPIDTENAQTYERYAIFPNQYVCIHNESQMEEYKENKSAYAQDKSIYFKDSAGREFFAVKTPSQFTKIKSEHIVNNGNSQ